MQNTALFPVMAHMRAVEAMLFALLEPRNTPTESNIPPRCEKEVKIKIHLSCDFCNVELNIANGLFSILQGVEHDACCSGAPLRAHGGGITD